MLTQTELHNFEDKLKVRKVQIEKNLRGTTLELEEMRELELNDEGDFAAASAETIVDSAILTQQRKELSEIELALDKIKKGTFGVCEMCEEPIGLARLKVKNFARFCITCREISEKKQK
ncbi:MAG TPA: RNA polymerase-binding protein DksA [Sulfurovum sp.]|jgi:DnaK suppressor protein|nr:MAG: molecular chaperone DnaK suppressor DksA [Sulfurovum sp. 35-42-20]OYY55643.1 MAG: molecular chaperone DnaK suppressor DksA [Sulfurovum sp. 28-43-6]OYZ26588.1 MAG: molecular chaperone DnaK suppressor DksA [Sulfurovum sp. 16-42-52]OYZ50675.1 MAG: molecular chaperone DnaK suppressor DksA [Sulfurovum sp. 24-42-9]OZA47129.1 MAG: molecular chaperone DnaK suppressor DksA [Sulfurovum sp. 17-42-90]OZA60776.1 MAG: molecular chaperone DnaK suppressor DksA [Sulfurovum sp. 39-42-12]HQR74564.1 RNA 